jgi:integral membrane protein
VTVTEISPSRTRTRTWFRTIAIAEAISWAGLLFGMFLKYVPETTELGVRIFGPIHGGVFILYVISCLVAGWKFGWGIKTLFFALASSIPPFFTYVFEVLADRRGLLGRIES